MKYINLYYFDENNYYTYTLKININSNIPSNSTLISPSFKKGYKYIWTGIEWLDIITKEMKLEEINKEYEKRASLIKIGVPESEILTWYKQEKEALDWEKDKNIETPFIDKIAEGREIDREILLYKIIEKVKAYNVYIGELTGIRQKLEDLINIYENNQEILNSISWKSYDLPN